MSVSRFRHTTGHVAKPQRQLLNVTSSSAMWDGSNTIACSDAFVAVPWQTFGGAAVFSHGASGRLAPNPPIVLGQEGPIIDVKFDPFDNHRLFTASEDGSIFGWDIPAGGLESNVSSPRVELRGHTKKCGLLSFHPGAKGVLASAAVDRLINLWDVERGTAVTTVSNLSEYATGLEWNLEGSRFCLTSRDKKLRTVDPRKCAVVSSVESHASARSQRCIWCKRKDVIMTLGCNENQQRQIKLWDTRKMDSPFAIVVLDQSSAAFMPVYDEDTNLLFVGSKGESNIKCFELMGDGLIPSYEVNAQDPMKGLCAMPKWSLDVRRCEFDRLYQLTYHSLLTIEMVLPRRQAGTEFQADVFPPTFADQPAMSAEAFFGGADAQPCEYDLSGVFDGHAPSLTKGGKTCLATTPATQPLASPPGGTKQSEVEVGRKLSSESLSESSTPAREGIADNTERRSTVHVDPLGDMTQRELFSKKQRLQELATKVRTCHQEIEAMRKALQAKEAEMLQFLEDIQSV
ncbi:coronin [Novymonas esmeraldas]|uniref:Coronin n=1 Tax=Novymonas esmeraldas TaxID=1808958 RepID=A0AAW0F2E6_9TRYP